MTDLPIPGSQPTMFDGRPEDGYTMIRATNVFEGGVTHGASDEKSSIYKASQNNE